MDHFLELESIVYLKNVVLKTDYSVTRMNGTFRYDACRLQGVWL